MEGIDMISKKDEAMYANQFRMKKNQAMTSNVCVTYLAVFGMLTAANFALTYISMDPRGLLYVALSLGILGFGYIGGYSHNNTLAIGAVVATLAAFIITRNILYLALLALTVPLLLFTIRANTVYEELSREPGFPQFEPRFEEQKRKSEEAARERAIWEMCNNNASLKANDLGGSQDIQEKAADTTDNSGFMDSI